MNQYRKTPRASWLAYNEGVYFITFCCKNKEHFLGEIYNDEMHLSEIGKIVDRELSTPSSHHSNIDIPLYTVMPNHIHAIVCVGTRRAALNEPGMLPENGDERALPGYVDAARRVPTYARNTSLLAAYVGSMKSAVTRQARMINPSFAWQSRYHDHVIRNNRDGNNIAHYIETNVARWTTDCFYN